MSREGFFGIDACLDEILLEKFGATRDYQKSLREVTLKRLRKKLCGADESFRTKQTDFILASEEENSSSTLESNYSGNPSKISRATAPQYSSLYSTYISKAVCKLALASA